MKKQNEKENFRGCLATIFWSLNFRHSSLITLKYHVCLAPSLTSHHSIFFTLFVGPIPVTRCSFFFFFFLQYANSLNLVKKKRRRNPEHTELVKEEEEKEKKKKREPNSQPRRRKGKKKSKGGQKLRLSIVYGSPMFNYNIVIKL